METLEANKRIVIFRASRPKVLRATAGCRFRTTYFEYPNPGLLEGAQWLNSITNKRSKTLLR